jgi:hypothetical protein
MEFLANLSHQDSRWLRNLHARTQQVRDDVFVGIPNHPGDAAQLSDFRGRALGVTACDQNPAQRVGAVDAAHQLPDFGIRPASDGAGVQNRHLACGNVIDLLEARFEQLLFDRRTVRLARPAAEIEKLKCRHIRLCEGGFTPSTGEANSTPRRHLAIPQTRDRRCCTRLAFQFAHTLP